MSGVIHDIRNIEQFIFAEVRCIDERRWDDWLALFDAGGDYWIPLCSEDEKPGINLSIVYEDLVKLKLRCSRYSHPLMHAQNPPSKTCHMISCVMLDRVNKQGDEYEISANFTMREYRLDRSIDWVGTFQYHLLKKAVDFHIKRKKVLLVDAGTQMETIQVLF